MNWNTNYKITNIYSKYKKVMKDNAKRKMHTQISNFKLQIT